MRTETKNELRQQLNNALATNRRLEKEISLIQEFDMPERLYLSVSQVCDILDTIHHAHLSLRDDASNQEGDDQTISDDSLVAIYQKECRLNDLMQRIKDQCRSKYEFSSPLQTHAAVPPTDDESLEIAND
mgnify:CR=1 FL=1|tara:strand:- start:2724 stop:3113 length:390 start_codon:yes stop_codon:yes gene_type:complete